jgi:predicted HTH domain antitoxin
MNELQEARLRYLLPPVLREFEALIGMSATLELARHFGGGELYIPKRVRPTHKITVLIGEEKAKLLSKNFGGERFKDFANAKYTLKRFERELTIERLKRGDQSLQSAARHLGIQTRRLRHYLNEEIPDQRPKYKQLDLF